ncbi:MAG: hypothetical protein FWC73_04555 [Defluviitaleaceae bacterium]|nr:hypothetical protein [Defluviitaleaceae bacterium]
MSAIRHWNNHIRQQNKDDGCKHPLGNGEMLVYEEGPEIVHIFGPPYTSPSMIGVTIEDEREIICESKREPKTAIWHHTFFTRQDMLGEMWDYVLPDSNIFVRDIDSHGETKLQIGLGYHTQAYFMPKYKTIGSRDAALFKTYKSTRFGDGYSSDREICMLVVAEGAAKLEYLDNGFAINISKGTGRILIGSHYEYGETVKAINNALSTSKDELTSHTRDYWYTYKNKGRDFESLIPASHPLRGKILETIDSVAVLIKAQQSTCGGVMAGHHYPMAYVRDMTGVLRGLLALGHKDEAKAILEFWFHKWQVYGDILNAEGMGNYGSRLFSGNDEAEIPAYIIFSCFFYYKKTGDAELIKRMLPMLEFAFEIQLSHLAGGMIEFSGDETYIAGNTFPRFCMYQGSAEATLLFIETGQMLVDYGKETGNEKLIAYEKIIGETRNLYKHNFVENGLFYANNPKREELAGKPDFRYFVCDAHLNIDGKYVFTWCEKNEWGFYVCPDCKDRVMEPFADAKKRFLLSSVAMVPMHMGSEMFTNDEIRRFIEPVVEKFMATGYVPSHVEGTRSLGYDYGFLLFNLTKLGHPAAKDVLNKMMSILDPTLAWVEYYDGDTPWNCRSRPWESGLNIEAIISYLCNTPA